MIKKTCNEVNLSFRPDHLKNVVPIIYDPIIF